MSPDVEAKITALWEDNSAIELVEFYPRIAYRARQLMRDGIARGWSLKPADAIHLATADVIQAQEFHTYDSSLEKYGPLISIPIVEPHTKQGRLF